MTHKNLQDLKFRMPIEKEAYQTCTVTRPRNSILIPNIKNLRMLQFRKLPPDLVVENYPIPNFQQDSYNKYLFDNQKIRSHSYYFTDKRLDYHIYEQYCQQNSHFNEKTFYENIIEQKYQYLFQYQQEDENKQFATFQQKQQNMKHQIKNFYVQKAYQKLLSEQSKLVRSYGKETICRSAGSQTLKANCVSVQQYVELIQQRKRIGSARPCKTQQQRCSSCIIQTEKGAVYGMDFQFQTRQQSWII